VLSYSSVSYSSMDPLGKIRVMLSLLIIVVYRHCLEFLYNDKILPYHLTVFQALRHFAADNDSEEELNPLGRTAIWTNTHTLQYVNVRTLSLAQSYGRANVG